MDRGLIRTAVLAMFLLVQQEALAVCSSWVREPLQADMAERFASETRRILMQHSPRTALVVRASTDPLGHRLGHAHVAFVFQEWLAPGEPWTVLHVLNECSWSRLYPQTDSLYTFFQGVPGTEATILVPGTGLQELISDRLLRSRPLQGHYHARHRLLAYPFGTRFQSSNQWVIEALALAISKTYLQDREHVHRWLQEAGYQPTVVNVASLKRMAGPQFRRTLSFDDHPFRDRVAGSVSLVTAESIITFVQAQDPEARVYRVRAFPEGTFGTTAPGPDALGVSPLSEHSGSRDFSQSPRRD